MSKVRVLVGKFYNFCLSDCYKEWERARSGGAGKGWRDAAIGVALTTPAPTRPSRSVRTKISARILFHLLSSYRVFFTVTVCSLLIDGAHFSLPSNTAR